MLVCSGNSFGGGPIGHYSLAIILINIYKLPVALASAQCLQAQVSPVCDLSSMRTWVHPCKSGPSEAYLAGDWPDEPAGPLGALLAEPMT